MVKNLNECMNDIIDASARALVGKVLKRFEIHNDVNEVKKETKELIYESHRDLKEFIKALKYGMPPTCGFGVSERLFSFMMNRPIRECVMFPLVRPEEGKQKKGKKK